jgi:hypothetical protein
MDRVCRTCRWSEVIPQTDLLRCHRMPPVVSFPAVARNDYCGEWSSPTIQQLNERAKASEDPAASEG